jgi:hypothetical protein
MSTAAEFRTHADEAMRWARLANNDRDRLALAELARTFRKSATRGDTTVVVHDGPAEVVAA